MKSPKTKSFNGNGTIVTTVAKGFGFIDCAQFHGLFFHSNELTNLEFGQLQLHQQVSFDIVMSREYPVAINVADGWRDDDSLPESTADPDVRVTIEDAAKRMAEIIATKPDTLETLEWRDLERVIAVVFAGLGFEVELTPGSNDGGKDIIISFTAANARSSFLVEIKHWRSRVGSTEVRKFLHVIAHNSAVGGLILATSGFSPAAIESLTEFERSTLRFGAKQKIVTLCKHYMRAAEGIWYPPRQIDQVIIEGTI